MKKQLPGLATPPFASEQRADGVWVYGFARPTREAVDCYVETSRRHDLIYIEQGGHLQRLILVAPGLVPTPYFASKAVRLIIATPPGLVESTAVHVPDSLGMRFLEAFLRQVPERLLATIRLFMDLCEAEAWLAERRALLIQSDPEGVAGLPAPE
ncbi:MAG: hypothetical protein HC915_13395 [Anaerolineae bacterium]|nr:hypothetical protein [Anaerolineae bacterium]